MSVPQLLLGDTKGRTQHTSEAGAGAARQMKLILTVLERSIKVPARRWDPDSSLSAILEVTPASPRQGSAAHLSALIRISVDGWTR